MSLEEFSRIELEKIKKPGMQLVYGQTIKNAGGDAESHLGGKPYALKGEEWPLCPFCKSNMNFFFQLREVDAKKKVSLKTFYKCDCELENFRPVIYLREYINPSESYIDHEYYKGRTFQDYLSVKLEPIWSAPSWNLLGSYNPQLKKKILDTYEDDEDAEDFYEDQRLFNGMIAQNPLNLLYGYPEFLSNDKDAVRCKCCDEFTSFYFQIDCIPQLDIDWNKGTLYAYVCPNTDTYLFLIKD